MRQLHVASAGMGTVGEAQEICVAQRGGLLFCSIGDRADALSKPKIRRCLDARVERLAPSLVSELNLLDRDPRIACHDGPP
jgi:hypothetical protein